MKDRLEENERETIRERRKHGKRTKYKWQENEGGTKRMKKIREKNDRET